MPRLIMLNPSSRRSIDLHTSMRLLRSGHLAVAYPAADGGQLTRCCRCRSDGTRLSRAAPRHHLQQHHQCQSWTSGTLGNISTSIRAARIESSASSPYLSAPQAPSAGLAAALSSWHAGPTSIPCQHEHS
eukprot:1120313-Rhodomonas_salina.1